MVAATQSLSATFHEDALWTLGGFSSARRSHITNFDALERINSDFFSQASGVKRDRSGGV